MKLAFMGTSSFAVPSLNALKACDYELDAVFTQPDRPAGRGQKALASPVKVAAQSLGVRLHQPESLKLDSFREEIGRLEPDLIVVVAYGKIIPPWLIEAPRHGVINLHASLLPKYRGAAPINWAILDGDSETGVCTMRIDQGLDTGPVYQCRSTAIGVNETAPELAARLATTGSALLIETIEAIRNGTIDPKPQEEEHATLAPRLRKEDGRIRWQESSRFIHNRIRGLLPWPAVVVRFRGTPCKLLGSRLTAKEASCGDPGAIDFKKRELHVLCGDRRWLQIQRLQLENRKPVSGAEFGNGVRLVEDDRFDDFDT